MRTHYRPPAETRQSLCRPRPEEHHGEGPAKIIKRYKLEKEFKLGKEMPSQDVMMKLYMRIQGIENAKGFQLDEAMLDSVIGNTK